MEQAMSTTSSNPNPTDEVKTPIITLKSADGEVFEVEKSIAMEFQTVKAFFDDDTDNHKNAIVPLPNVKARHLSVLIEYLQKQKDIRRQPDREEEELRKHEEEFVKGFCDSELKEIILAMNYLNNERLFEALSAGVASRIENKSVEFVREFLGIENDFTPEEEEALRAVNSWAFEGVDED